MSNVLLAHTVTSASNLSASLMFVALASLKHQLVFNAVIILTCSGSVAAPRTRNVFAVEDGALIARHNDSAPALSGYGNRSCGRAVDAGVDRTPRHRSVNQGDVLTREFFSARKRAAGLAMAALDFCHLSVA